MKVITNGFDSDDFTEASTSAREVKLISHIGMLSNQRNPQVLWESLSKLASTEKFQLKLTGIISSEVLNDIQAFEGLKDMITVQDSIPHAELSEHYAGSDLLLLIQTKTDRLQTQLPGKLFEYLQAKKPILCIGDTESDLARILAETDAGACYAYDDKLGVLTFLKAFFSGELQFEFQHIEKYNRKALTEALSSWLSEL